MSEKTDGKGNRQSRRTRNQPPEFQPLDNFLIFNQKSAFKKKEKPASVRANTDKVNSVNTSNHSSNHNLSVKSAENNTSSAKKNSESSNNYNFSSIQDTLNQKNNHFDKNNSQHKDTNVSDNTNIPTSSTIFISSTINYNSDMTNNQVREEDRLNSDEHFFNKSFFSNPHLELEDQQSDEGKYLSSPLFQKNSSPLYTSHSITTPTQITPTDKFMGNHINPRNCQDDNEDSEELFYFNDSFEMGSNQNITPKNYHSGDEFVRDEPDLNNTLPNNQFSFSKKSPTNTKSTNINKIPTPNTKSFQTNRFTTLDWSDEPMEDFNDFVDSNLNNTLSPPPALKKNETEFLIASQNSPKIKKKTSVFVDEIGAHKFNQTTQAYIPCLQKDDNVHTSQKNLSCNDLSDQNFPPLFLKPGNLSSKNSNKPSWKTAMPSTKEKHGNLEGCKDNTCTPKGTNSFNDKVLNNLVNGTENLPKTNSNQQSWRTENPTANDKTGNLEGCNVNISTLKGKTYFNDIPLKSLFNSLPQETLLPLKGNITSKSFATAAATANKPKLNNPSSVKKTPNSSELKYFTETVLSGYPNSTRTRAPPRSIYLNAIRFSLQNFSLRSLANNYTDLWICIKSRFRPDEEYFAFEQPKALYIDIPLHSREEYNDFDCSPLEFMGEKIPIIKTRHNSEASVWIKFDNLPSQIRPSLAKKLLIAGIKHYGTYIEYSTHNPSHMPAGFGVTSASICFLPNSKYMNKMDTIPRVIQLAYHKGQVQVTPENTRPHCMWCNNLGHVAQSCRVKRPKETTNISESNKRSHLQRDAIVITPTQWVPEDQWNSFSEGNNSLLTDTPKQYFVFDQTTKEKTYPIGKPTPVVETPLPALKKVIHQPSFQKPTAAFKERFVNPKKPSKSVRIAGFKPTQSSVKLSNKFDAFHTNKIATDNKLTMEKEANENTLIDSGDSSYDSAITPQAQLLIHTKIKRKRKKNPRKPLKEILEEMSKETNPCNPNPSQPNFKPSVKVPPYQPMKWIPVDCTSFSELPPLRKVFLPPLIQPTPIIVQPYRDFSNTNVNSDIKSDSLIDNNKAPDPPQVREFTSKIKPPTNFQNVLASDTQKQKKTPLSGGGTK